MNKFILFVLILLCLSGAAVAQQSENDRAMNRPVEPFPIIGNIYYVGASDVTSYLITTPKGHILIDSGYEETVPQIKANVAKLGFKLEDVKILLLNHAHYDHCGGLAELKKLTGARLLVSPPDASVLEDGGRSDFYFGGDKPVFPAVKVDERLTDGQTIALGGTSLKVIFTPGHTKGATSWTTDVTDGGRKYKVAFVSSLTTLDYKLADNPKYPEIAADYARTFQRLEKLKPDVFLVSHGVFFDLTEKAAKLRAGAGPNPFIDPAGYRTLIAGMKKSFEDRLKKEKTPEKK
ncbi:MAG: subclass B3 metallo-beta-lactamase [Acidobacteria bacterium]|nr:subclass B3 metallo-beta-lactamase [Acidobacteriota bacterium]